MSEESTPVPPGKFEAALKAAQDKLHDERVLSLAEQYAETRTQLHNIVLACLPEDFDATRIRAAPAMIDGRESDTAVDVFYKGVHVCSHTRIQWVHGKGYEFRFKKAEASAPSASDRGNREP